MIYINYIIFIFYFNSIKVRLNPWSDAFYSRAPFKFQFHKGTIKPGARLNAANANVVFQFHKGTIKPRCF